MLEPDGLRRSRAVNIQELTETRICVQPLCTADAVRMSRYCRAHAPIADLRPAGGHDGRAALEAMDAGEPQRATSSCRSCSAPIVWAASEKTGARMPLDAEPVENGTILLRHEEAGAAAQIAHVTKAEERVELAGIASAVGETLRLYVSHFATCPNAPSHRKRSSA